MYVGGQKVIFAANSTKQLFDVNFNISGKDPIEEKRYNSSGTFSSKNEPKKIKIDPEQIKRLLDIIYKARGTK